jgi:hypothetical protein
MTVTKQSLINYGYARGLVISFLFLAASGIMGREDHIVLRVLVCVVGLWGIAYARALHNRRYAALFIACIVVFNPLWHPAGLGKTFWSAVNIAIALVFGASILGLSSKPAAPQQ